MLGFLSKGTSRRVEVKTQGSSRSADAMGPCPIARDNVDEEGCVRFWRSSVARVGRVEAILKSP